LTLNPGYLEKVPANLKSKASKYLPVEEAASDSTSTTVSMN